MTPLPALLVRADASAEIGTGHVMRCLALAQAWQDGGGQVALAAAEIPPALVERLREERVDFYPIAGPRGGAGDAAQTLALAQELEADWLAVDGYEFDAEYLGALRLADARVLVVDDMAHQLGYPADLLLNQNLSATPARYAGRVAGETQLLLGPRYSLLRREFRTLTAREARGPHPLRVLVSFGGGDAENFTATVLRGLGRTHRPIEVVLLAGAANPHAADLRRSAALARFPCEVLRNVTNVARMMRWADVAITAGGSTVWELASLGVPALIAVHEDNQIAGADALRAVPFFRVCRAADLAGRNLDEDLAALAALPVADEGAYDALGAPRVVAAMQALTRRRVTETHFA